MNARLIGVGVAALAAMGGGGRLIYDEVQLSSGVSAAQERYRQDDATRASRLTLDLAEAEGSIATLRSSVASATDDARAAHARVEALDAELAAVRRDLGATVAERSARVDELTATLSEARATQARADAAFKARTKELKAASESIASLKAERAQLQLQTAELDRQAQGLAQELTQREEVLKETAAARDAANQSLSQTREHLDATQTELAAALKTAAEKDAVLKALTDAGVDVARLSGADPMPLVRGFVARVDAAAVPPIVLVHVGAKSGLREGDQLYVVRKGRRVATLEVDALQEDLCTTRIVKGERGLALVPRDEVFSWQPER